MKNSNSNDIVTSDFSQYLSKERIKSLKSLSHFDSHTKRDRSKYNEHSAHQKALYIADKLHNPTRLLFYLKCAWNLTDEYLDRLLDIAMKKNDPIKYFSAAASREMTKNS